MRRLLKIPLAGAVIALARMLIRRLLEGEDREASVPASATAPPAAARRDPVRKDRSPTRDELYKEAARLDIKGRSKMNKRQLQKAVEDATIGGRP